MPLVGGFSRGYPVSPPSHSGAAPYSPKSPTSAFKTSLKADLPWPRRLARHRSGVRKALGSIIGLRAYIMCQGIVVIEVTCLQRMGDVWVLLPCIGTTVDDTYKSAAASVALFMKLRRIPLVTAMIRIKNEREFNQCFGVAGEWNEIREEYSNRLDLQAMELGDLSRKLEQMREELFTTLEWASLRDTSQVVQTELVETLSDRLTIDTSQMTRTEMYELIDFFQRSLSSILLDMAEYLSSKETLKDFMSNIGRAEGEVERLQGKFCDAELDPERLMAELVNVYSEKEALEKEVGEFARNIQQIENCLYAETKAREAAESSLEAVVRQLEDEKFAHEEREALLQQALVYAKPVDNVGTIRNQNCGRLGNNQEFPRDSSTHPVIHATAG
ncbi:hypothetical protein PR048_015007 [Dryococelus australis]|uniref:Uncharacterized protein n=1 Tax=Dryococelus australis TaxID=614101 RepID=A0ABQ9HFT1_9NEOP|nr:hypothetical protein PR048_015007 [Dryococelus australis]